MPIRAQWWVFTDVIIDSEQDLPGVYELGNAAGEAIYIGSSNEIRRRLMQHWNESNSSCVKRNTRQYRVEYTGDYLVRERELFDEHVKAHGQPPLCSASAP
jgi:hypothetical protein